MTLNAKIHEISFESEKKGDARKRRSRNGLVCRAVFFRLCLHTKVTEAFIRLCIPNCNYWTIFMALYRASAHYYRRKKIEKKIHIKEQRRSKTSEIGKNVDFGKRWNHFIFLNCSQIVNYILRFVIESDMVASNNHTKRTFLFILSVVLCYFILHNEKKNHEKFVVDFLI